MERVLEAVAGALRKETSIKDVVVVRHLQDPPTDMRLPFIGLKDGQARFDRLKERTATIEEGRISIYLYVATNTGQASHGITGTEGILALADAIRERLEDNQLYSTMDTEKPLSQPLLAGYIVSKSSSQAGKYAGVGDTQVMELVYGYERYVAEV